MNAIGYAPQQNVVYGIARHGGGHLVRISTQGTLSDLGRVSGAHGGLSDAVAGAVLGSDLCGAADGRLSVDPGSGAVREVRVVQGLPGWASYGSVVVAGQVMYAIADDVFGQSRLYRIPLDGSGPAIQLASWSPAEVTDLAGCLGTAAPPTTTPAPTSPPPKPVPTPRHIALPQAQLVAKASDQERDTQRRWALTAVVIIFGGGAVAARRASARARRPR